MITLSNCFGVRGHEVQMLCRPLPRGPLARLYNACTLSKNKAMLIFRQCSLLQLFCFAGALLHILKRFDPVKEIEGTWGHVDMCRGFEGHRVCFSADVGGSRQVTASCSSCPPLCVLHSRIHLGFICRVWQQMYTVHYDI